MIYLRYIYEDGLDIITPVKHGSRWLEEKTNPLKIIDTPLYDEQLIEIPITENTYWVYRDSREHLLSALKTEIRTAIEYNTDTTENIVTKYLNGIGHHWSSTNLKTLYTYWKDYNVIPIKLSELSSLFDSNLEFKKYEYEMIGYRKTNYNDNDFILNQVGNDKMELLYKMADDDMVWLNKIINNEK